MPLPSNVKLSDVIAKLQVLTGINQIPDLKEALQAKGITLTGNETMVDLVNLVKNNNLVMTADATAIAGDVLSGKTAYSLGAKVTGNMPNYGDLPKGGGYVGAESFKVDGAGSLVIEPKTGYYKSGLNTAGFGSILLNDPDLISGNLPNDVNIFGIQGTLERLTTADRNSIIAAIVAKGVAASPEDTNSQLASKIRQISNIRSFTITSSGQVSNSSAPAGYVYSQVLGTIPAGATKVFGMSIGEIRGGTGSYGSGYTYSKSEIILATDTGGSMQLLSQSTTGNFPTSLDLFMIDLNAMKLKSYTSDMTNAAEVNTSYTLPSSYNGALSIIFRTYNSVTEYPGNVRGDRNINGLIYYQ